MPNRRYETLILIDIEQGDAGCKDLVARIRSLAETQGAAISQVQEWGARELAYPIGRQRRAYHVLLEYRATPAALAEIERNLKLMEPVLRHLSVRQAENAPPAVNRAVLAVEPAPAPMGRPRDGEEAVAEQGASGGGDMTDGEGV